MTYLLLLTIIWGLGLSIYVLLLRGLQIHNFNRAYLLLSHRGRLSSAAASRGSIR